MPKTYRQNANHILDAFEPASYDRMSPALELVSLALGQVIYESDSHQDYVYFPTTAIISLLYIMEDGHSAEIAVAGNEGLVGIALFMGGDTVPSRAIVQSAGDAYRLPGSQVKREFRVSSSSQHLLLLYTQALMAQMSQTAVCNRHHPLDKQLCRWLLMSLDRLPSNKLTMTHELIANMLGVQRSGITLAAKKLQDAGVIDYQRGHIAVLNREELEARVCECYGVVKREYDRLFAPVDE